MDAVDLSGKTIRPFCTHEGSGASGTQSKIKKAEPDATVKNVLALRGTTAQNNAATVKKEVSNWLEK